MNQLLKKLLLTGLIITYSIVGQSQDRERRNVIGIGLQVFPVKNSTRSNSSSKVREFGINLSIEYERFLNPKNSISIRGGISAYSYFDEGELYEESGKGNGPSMGFSYKHFFSSRPYQGFFIGSAVELVNFNETYKSVEVGFRQNTLNGKRESFIVVPNISSGYRANLGNVFSITGALFLGYRAETIKEEEGDFKGLAGKFVGGLGVRASWRF